MHVVVALLGSTLRRFLQREDGSMSIYSMMLLLPMLLVAGMSVDVMRHETTRARLQSALDRATLAATDLRQSLDEDRTAESVVRDYVETAGMADYLAEVTVQETLNSRSVEVSASMDIDTVFMRLAGVGNLAVNSSSTAEEARGEVEIVLVLDISESMVAGGRTRLANLKIAAQNFVAQVLENDTEGRVSIAIVPFSNHVNLPEALAAQYNIIDRVTTTEGVNCVEFPPAAFQSVSLSTELPLRAASWVDVFTLPTTFGGYVPPERAAPREIGRICPNIPGNLVRLPGNSVADLQANIRGLVGQGTTSINDGMRWGLALLDPATRPVFDRLIAAGELSAALRGRPFDWDRPAAQKIIVVMTDGDHVGQDRLNPGYREGPSPIWRSAGGQYSILDPNRFSSDSRAERCRPFYVPHLNRWHVRPWNGNGGGAMALINCAEPADFDGEGEEWSDGNATRQDWREVWARLPMAWVVMQLYERSGINDFWGQYDAFRSKTVDREMDAQLATMCDMAKANDVTVYGIAFEAPARGQQVIQNCASSLSHYFYTTTSEIDTTFSSIASHIVDLRLVR